MGVNETSGLVWNPLRSLPPFGCDDFISSLRGDDFMMVDARNEGKSKSWSWSSLDRSSLLEGLYSSSEDSGSLKNDSGMGLSAAVIV